MKIIYLTHCEQDTMDYFIKLRETEKIGDADVIVIDGERYKNKTMDPSERVDTEHFISYDYNDLYFRRRGIGGGDNFIHYVLMSEKVLDRIKPYEDVILIADKERYDDALSFMISLKEKKNFRLHIISDISDSYESNDYHQYIRVQRYLEIITSFCFINTWFVIKALESDDYKERIKKRQEYLFERINEIVPHMKNLRNKSLYIYDHYKQEYTEIERPEYSGKSMVEYITPSEDNKDMCLTLYNYRKAFAEKHKIDMRGDRICGKCSCLGYCKTVCSECDFNAGSMWDKVYFYPYEYGDKQDEEFPYEFDDNIGLSYYGIDRFRINTDGNGIRSLILTAGCPLDCKYCGNKKYKEIFPSPWYDSLGEFMSIYSFGWHFEKDGIYYEMTDGGVTFGGGEPLLQADFIKEFHRKYPMWDIVIESCLNVDFEQIEKIASFIGYWYIDIKDMNPEIYEAYTGKNNEKVISNLKKLLSIVPQEKICIRIPRIPDFNTENDVEKSAAEIKQLGYSNIEVFDYVKYI